MAIRRSPAFRFDYYLRSLTVDVIGKRCEQLMRFAEKEVEHLEQKAREQAGLPVEPGKDGKPLPPIELPEISIMRDQIRASKKKDTEAERQKLEEKVSEVEVQMKEVQDRLKALNESDYESVSPMRESSERRLDIASEKENVSRNSVSSEKLVDEPNEIAADETHANDRGAIGPEGDFVEFPEYDGSEMPKESRKAFTHYCLHTRKEVKASLDPSERKNKVIYHGSGLGACFKLRLIVCFSLGDRAWNIEGALGGT